MTVTTAEARADFSRIARAVAQTGEAVTVFRHSRPWVQIAPVPEDDWGEVPNAATQQAVAEARARRGSARFTSVGELMAALKAEPDAAG